MANHRRITWIPCPVTLLPDHVRPLALQKGRPAMIRNPDICYCRLTFRPVTGYSETAMHISTTNPSTESVDSPFDDIYVKVKGGNPLFVNVASGFVGSGVTSWSKLTFTCSRRKKTVGVGTPSMSIAYVWGRSGLSWAWVDLYWWVKGTVGWLSYLTGRCHRVRSRIIYF